MFTIDDLYQFFLEQNKTCSFSSKESDSTIIVQIPEKMTFSDEYDPTFNLLPVHLMSCHLSENRNHSSISRESMEEAIPSFFNRPILGYIQKIDDGDGKFHYDFAGHEMEYDEDGNIEYKEVVVGVIPESCNPKIVYNEEHQKDYLEVDGFIYNDYTKAAEILKEKGECDVSVEISVDQLSFDSKSKVMLIDQFHFLGVCILGVTTDDSHQEILPGMEGSNITISDFSAENNSFVFNKQDLVQEISASLSDWLDDKLAQFAQSTTTERREESVAENLKLEFEETESEEEVKVIETESEEVTTTEEEDETPAIETESSKTEEAVESDDDTPEEVVEEFEDEPEEEEETEDDESDEDTHQSTSVKEDEDSTGTRVDEYNLHITLGEKNFELSLSDIQFSIETIVNEMYAEADNTYYGVIVYTESKTVVMVDMWNSNKAYRQSYKDRKGVYSLVGSRVPVHSVFVTPDEEAELDRIRSNYSAMESELNAYKSAELHTQRESVLASEEYSVMADFAEFTELKSNMDNYSVEDLTKEADLLYAKFMKSNYSTFAAKEQPKKRSMVFMSSGENTQEEKLPYGGLFKNFKGKK